MKHIGIIGARKYKDRQSVIDLVNTIPADSIVVTSSCRGVCQWAGEAAKTRGLSVKIFSPDLTRVRDRIEMVERYYERNRQLIAACDIVHAFRVPLIIAFLIEFKVPNKNYFFFEFEIDFSLC